MWIAGAVITQLIQFEISADLNISVTLVGVKLVFLFCKLSEVGCGDIFTYNCLSESLSHVPGGYKKCQIVATPVIIVFFEILFNLFFKLLF